MRIGIVARSIDRQGSGVRRYILSITRALLAIDRKNEYVIYYNKASYLGMNPAATEHVIKTPSRLIWDHIALPLAVRRDRIDVLLCTRNVVPPLVRCKSVVAIHDTIHILYPRYFDLKDSIYMNLGIRWSLKKSDAIIAVSQSTKRDLISKLGAKGEKIHCVYEAADDNYRPINSHAQLQDVSDKYNLPADFILSVAGLQRRKNLPNLIKAFSQVSRMPEINQSLVMIGAPLWQHSAIANELNISPVRDRIVWLKFVPEEDLPAIYNLATTLVFPSLYEGFGLPVLEAMACSCPVVCSNTSSLAEIAGDAAITVDPTDVEQLTEGIHRILTESDLRNSLIGKGLERASKFSWERAARETLEVLEGVHRNPSYKE